MDISNEVIMEYLNIEGSVHAGFAKPETLEGDLSSTDLSYVMPSAKAAIVFALPLKLDAMDPDRRAMYEGELEPQKLTEEEDFTHKF
jgi:epoxyqueuosine reductase QueG